MTTTGRDEILELVAAGKISAAEAATLLSKAGAVAKPPDDTSAADTAAPDAGVHDAGVHDAGAGDAPRKAIRLRIETDDHDEPSAEPSKTETASVETAAARPSWLKVRVSGRDGADRVRVNIPLRVLRLGMRIGAGFVPELKRQDWADMDQLLAESGHGLIVDVQDEAAGERVQVYLE